MAPIYGLVPLIVLVPLIPAYILFKTLGSKADVTGKEFFGFTVQLGGAFAGYFVLILLLVHVFGDFLKPSGDQMVYHLKGTVVDDRNQGIDTTQARFKLTPEQKTLDTNSSGYFDLAFIVDPKKDTSYPEIQVSYTDFLPTDLYLDPTHPSNRSEKVLKLHRNDVDHVIYADPIALARADSARDVHVSEVKEIASDAAMGQQAANPQAAPPGYR